jgi:hypothetical protein
MRRKSSIKCWALRRPRAKGDFDRDRDGPLVPYWLRADATEAGEAGGGGGGGGAKGSGGGCSRVGVLGGVGRCTKITSWCREGVSSCSMPLSKQSSLCERGEIKKLPGLACDSCDCVLGLRREVLRQLFPGTNFGLIVDGCDCSKSRKS